MNKTPKKCELCGTEMPSWATRCSNCEDAKFVLEQKNTPKPRQKEWYQDPNAQAVPLGMQKIKKPKVEPNIEPVVIYQESKSEIVQERIEISAVYLGGMGAKISKGIKGRLVVSDLGFFYENNKGAWSVDFEEIQSIQIAGSGAFQTGGGWIGGGFGFSGAMQGAAMASMMNLLTTRTHFDCILRIIYKKLDLTFQILDRNPRQLEIDLTGVAHIISTNQSENEIETPVESSGIDALLKLSLLYEKGLLTKEEFEEQKTIYLKKK
jgi:hypothetical protein